MAERDLGLRYWQAQRVSRRKVLAGAAVGGAAIGTIAIVGCGGSSKKTSGTPSAGTSTSTQTKLQDGTQDGTAKPGGILNVRQGGPLPSMKVFGPSILALAQGLYLGFTTYDHMWYTPTDTGVRELFLATQVEQPDALTVINLEDFQYWLLNRALPLRVPVEGERQGMDLHELGANAYPELASHIEEFTQR